MPTHHVLILGAGAAGVAAATALARHEDIHVTLVGRTHETPYIRMHITGVAFGPTLPETIHAPLPPVTVLADTATHLDPISRIVHLASGAQLRYDAVIIATGSRPDTLTPGLPGRHTPAARHQVVTLHSIQDAQQIREHLTRTAGPSRVAIYGGGFTGAETASALHAAGHHVALISRSRIPGRASFGAQIAAHITGIHRGKITTFLGRTITAVRDRSPLLGITLDDTTTLSADLLITASATPPPHRDRSLPGCLSMTGCGALPRTCTRPAAPPYTATTTSGSGAWITGPTRPRKDSTPPPRCSTTAPAPPTRDPTVLVAPTRH